jgi:hypothetical protein
VIGPGLGAGVREGGKLFGALREEHAGPVGSLVVSGMLAEPLARELGAGARPGAVRVREDGALAGAEVAVRVVAGEPSAEDRSLVDEADRAGIPVVLVQLWPQEKWTEPFVLTPFVVECRAGEGFPVGEIADRISEAVERAPELAATIPVLRPSVEQDVVRGSVVRAALLGALGARRGSSRPALALAQAQTVSRLRALDPQLAGTSPDPRALAGSAALVYASGFALRALARTGRGKLPAPLVHAAVAAGGTWALAEGVRRLERLLAGAGRD